MKMDWYETFILPPDCDVALRLAILPVARERADAPPSESRRVRSAFEVGRAKTRRR
jgi:hypothetical protein